MLSVLSFNILAPNFALPSHYPPGMGAALSQDYRRQATTRFLLQMKEVCDIMAFQEVTHGTPESASYNVQGSSNCQCSYDEFTYLQRVLGDKFVGMFYPHESYYWNDYGGYVPNGNALFFRRAIFSDPVWSDVPLHTGNHAILGQVTHLASMRNFRVLNIHLDSELEDRRKRELSYALRSLDPDPNYIDIITGDFNMETSDSNYSIVRQLGFRGFGNQTPTFSFMMDSPIDHIVYRDLCGCALIPILGKSRVLDGGLWNRFPKLGLLDIFAGSRLKACLELYGSDHVPVLAVFVVSANIMTCEL